MKVKSCSIPDESGLKSYALKADFSKSAQDYKVGARVVMSTVAHVKNCLGHLYMFFVKPMHRIIAPGLLSKI